MSKVVFIGQGPNKTAWEAGLALGKNIIGSRPLKDGDRSVEEIAEDYCDRLAITGAIGSRLAALLGTTLAEFWRTYDRRNLNSRWNGKSGKGDVFDSELGTKTAGQLLVGPWTRYVLLGGAVSACFTFKNPEWLAVTSDWVTMEMGERDVKKEFLIFPHPSAINVWWNEPFNAFRAKKRLQEFVL